MTALIGVEDTKEIGRLFRSRLKDEVEVVLFISDRSSAFCSETRQLLEEVAFLDDRVKLKVLDLEKEASRAREMAVDLAPTIVVVAPNGAKLFFVGTPAGRQLRSLVEGIVDASRGRSEMDEETRSVIGRVNAQTVIRVFVTTFCPYSPLVVRSAHRFALENRNIRSIMVETTAFPELAKKYDVLGVPRTVIDDVVGFDGAPAENAFAKMVLEAASRQDR